MMFSHSRLKTYEDCPRKYAFQYIEKPDIERRTSVEQFMGSAVHACLEKLYRAVQMERVPKWEEVRDAYEDYWQRNWTEDVLIVRTEFTADDYRNVGRRCLQDYFVAQYPFVDGRVLALEERVLIDLDPSGQYKLQGYIDRLAEREDGTIEIHDYKTSRRLPSQDELNRERQLALYQMGIERRWTDVRSVRLIWHYLRANRTMVSVRSRDSLDELKSETIQLIDSIVAAAARSDFPPHESQLCDWCEFYSICPAKRHPYATATLGPEEFSTDRGVQLADQYVAAARAKTQAEDEWSRARQEVLDFAKANNLTRLQGHGATVGVTRRTELALPTQDDPNRTVLESLVRASGQWEKVSELSRSKLPKAIQGDLFDPATRGQIAALLTPRQIEIVRERKLAREEFDDGPDV